jgi:hypothetical protein
VVVFFFINVKSAMQLRNYIMALCGASFNNIICLSPINIIIVVIMQ